VLGVFGCCRSIGSHRGGCLYDQRLPLVAGPHLPPELDHLFLKVDHSLGAHGCQSDEFHDYGPYPAMAGKGFVELGEPVVEFPSDNGFGIELYPPHFAERREVGCFFGIGCHLASLGRLPRPGGPERHSCRASTTWLVRPPLLAPSSLSSRRIVVGIDRQRRVRRIVPTAGINGSLEPSPASSSGVGGKNSTWAGVFVALRDAQTAKDQPALPAGAPAEPSAAFVGLSRSRWLLVELAHLPSSPVARKLSHLRSMHQPPVFIYNWPASRHCLFLNLRL
jgi:hypothetical protein